MKYLLCFWLHVGAMAMTKVLSDYMGQVEVETIIDGESDCVHSLAQSPRRHAQRSWLPQCFQGYCGHISASLCCFLTEGSTLGRLV